MPVNENPELTFKDGGISFSDWVIGTYNCNLISPFRVVRYYKDKGGKTGWEYADCQGENEDLFDIASPDSWQHFQSR